MKASRNIRISMIVFLAGSWFVIADVTVVGSLGINTFSALTVLLGMIVWWGRKLIWQN